MWLSDTLLLLILDKIESLLRCYVSFLVFKNNEIDTWVHVTQFLSPNYDRSFREVHPERKPPSITIITNEKSSKFRTKMKYTSMNTTNKKNELRMETEFSIWAIYTPTNNKVWGITLWLQNYIVKLCILNSPIHNIRLSLTLLLVQSTYFVHHQQ